jgi:hypothetical protein
MSGRSVTFFPIVAAGLFSAMIGLSPERAAAGDDCLAAPNREPGPGERWLHHLDTTGTRQCWHLVGSAPSAAATPAPEAQQSSGLQSFFSSLTSGFSAPAQAAPQGAAPRDDKQGAADPSKRPRLASRQDPGDPAPQPKRHRDTRTTGERADLPLDEAKREALFQEFIRWKAQHNQD